MAEAERAARELNDALADFETLLKNGEVFAYLTGKGINASLALLIVQGLGAYLHGDKATAADDLRTAAEEIEARLAPAEPSAGNGANGGALS